jgi:hypothetical protein
MGPTLVGKDVVYKQMLTDPGMFAILSEPVVRCSRSSPRHGQNEMLRIIAYVRTLDK